MTVIERLRARHFRNLSEFDVRPRPGINWILGGNAAGKTALLESIYCLSRKRSFRGRRFGSVVSTAACEAQVEGWLNGVYTVQSVRFLAGTSSNARRIVASDLGQGFSVRLICDATHALVEGEPGLRRRFFDWNVCLWDADSIEEFRHFARVAAQRNAWLRQGCVGSDVWDRPYASALHKVLERRSRFFREISEAFRALTREEQWFRDVELERSGVHGDSEQLLERLRAGFSKDRERGYTSLGSARWDFRFVRNGKIWFGSRGEGKILGTLLQVAAETVVSRVRGSGSVWLIDDIDAELSPEWSERIVELLGRYAGQMFVTSLPGKLDGARTRQPGTSVFHVERGVVRRISVP
jgi:DNA replication and repair protein RecF